MAEIVVVGAGIVGASIAYHAACRGPSVTVLDPGPPVTAATGASFGWIGRHGHVPARAAALHAAVLVEYRRLIAELPRVEVRWCGSLSWPVGASSTVADDVRVITGTDVAALEPALRVPPERALHVVSDGVVDPAAVIAAMLAGARDRGAVIVEAAVTAVRERDGRVVGVETSGGFVPARTVVLAAGVGIPALAAKVAVPASPAVYLRFAAAPGLVRGVVDGPDVEVRQDADGTLHAAAPYSGERTDADLRRTALRTAARIAAAFRGADDLSPTAARIGMRPVPADGAPVIGPLRAAGAYVAVMHSAVTLAPVVGRLVAQEIVDGPAAPELAGCRPRRG